MTALTPDICPNSQNLNISHKIIYIITMRYRKALGFAQGDMGIARALEYITALVHLTIIYEFCIFHIVN